MEAKAKHDFNKTENDELAFKKNDILKVLNQTNDANWFKAELNGRQGYIPKNYIEMTKADWYINKGRLTRAQAEDQLLEKKHGHFVQPDGAFLVRNSESNPGDFSLSVKYGDTVQHFKIMNDLAGKYFVWVVKHTSINELVKHHRENSVSRDRAILLKDMVPSTPVAPVQMYVKALYDFEPQDTGELRFSKGQVIGVIDSSEVNWWTGELSGEVGQFPRTYVEVMNS